VGFDALVNWWDKCNSVGAGYVKKTMLFQVWTWHVLCFISICDLFTDSSSVKCLASKMWPTCFSEIMIKQTHI
jgi:hypothetical protein